MKSENLFQSPRSGKFVSDKVIVMTDGSKLLPFQSPRSGKFVSDFPMTFVSKRIGRWFQSPRSGKFVSDKKEWRRMDSVQT